MPKAYLTIDDSPSGHTDDLVDFLSARQIPALLFVRGDLLEANPAPITRAIQKGLLIGNHTYSHRRASENSIADTQVDILKCEALIEAAYKSAGVARSHKTFRFSYLDRGAGSWVVDFDQMAAVDCKAAQAVFWDGLNFCDRQKPDAALFDKQAMLQEFLSGEGFVAPFQGVDLGWYQNSEIAKAKDCFFTYSTSDWMLTKRHLAKNWPYKSLAALEKKIDEDPVLAAPESAQIILAHDQAEIFEPVCALVDYFQAKSFEFLDF